MFKNSKQDKNTPTKAPEPINHTEKTEPTPNHTKASDLAKKFEVKHTEPITTVKHSDTKHTEPVKHFEVKHTEPVKHSDIKHTEPVKHFEVKHTEPVKHTVEVKHPLPIVVEVKPVEKKSEFLFPAEKTQESVKVVEKHPEVLIPPNIELSASERVMKSVDPKPEVMIFASPNVMPKSSSFSSKKSVPLHFEMNYNTTDNQVLAVIGSTDFLGNWNSERALRLKSNDKRFWSLDCVVDVEQALITFEYKYVVMDCESGMIIRWEGGANRETKVSKEQLRKDFADAWNN